jgi:hypothetical protein
MTRPSARAVRPPPPGAVTRIKGVPAVRPHAATTFRADEIDTLRILCNAALMGNQDQARSLIRTPAFQRLHRKAIGLYDRVTGKATT